MLPGISLAGTIGVYPVQGTTVTEGTQIQINWQPDAVKNVCLARYYGSGLDIPVYASGPYRYSFHTPAAGYAYYSVYCYNPNNGNETDTGAVGVTVNAAIPNPTSTFTATPTTIMSGTNTSLTWTSTNASSCTLKNGATTILSSLNQTAYSYGPLTTTTLSLVCQPLPGAPGSAITKNVTITVTSPVPTLTLTAASTSVALGKTTTLTWGSTQMSSCTVKNGASTTLATGISGTVVSSMITNNETFTLTCTKTAGGTATATQAVTVVLPVVDIPEAVYPAIPAGSANKTYLGTTYENDGYYMSDGDTFVATDKLTYGGAVTQVVRGSNNFVQNDPPLDLKYIRGGSLQGTFFFNTPMVGATPDYPTFYNDCNNPLETGSVADVVIANGANRGLTSPTIWYKSAADRMVSTADLVYYVNPNAATDFYAYDPTTGGHVGTPVRKTTCFVAPYGLNNPDFTLNNNTATSTVKLGKSAAIGNIGTSTKPTSMPGVLTTDMVVRTVETYHDSGFLPAFNSVKRTEFPKLSVYDPRTKALTALVVTTNPTVDAKFVAVQPIIAHSVDGTKAMAIFSPDKRFDDLTGLIPYFASVTSNGFTTIQSIYRYPGNAPAGDYKFRSHYVFGTLAQVQASIDALYDTYKYLVDPKVFNWYDYQTLNSLSFPNEEAARLHWITVGIDAGLKSKSNFDVKLNMPAGYGTNYFAAVKYYVLTH
ncbi:MAG: hypothetical protein WAX38_04535 [Minisyncoccia bacterium]